MNRCDSIVSPKYDTLFWNRQILHVKDDVRNGETIPLEKEESVRDCF